MDEYIRIVLEQIRCKKIHASIAQELRQHIEDQTEANQALGMEKTEALSAAVKDMGNPVEAGISLDRIHKPRMAWSILLLMAVISLCSLLLHIVIFTAFASSANDMDPLYIQRNIAHITLGFGVMLIFYRLDYTFFAKYAMQTAALFYLFLYLGVFCLGTMINGAVAFVIIGPFRLSLIHLSFFSVPLYGALLCRYRGGGWRGIGKAVLWMLPPVWICFHIPCLSHTLLVFFMMALLLTLAVCKKWFRVSTGKFLALFWGTAFLSPAAWIAAGVALHLFADYQTMRIRNFLSGGASQYNYVGNLLNDYLEHARVFGGSGMEIAGYLPEYNSSYIFTFLSSYYGLAASVLVCLLILFTTCKMLRISLKQQNHAGMMIGCGCSIVLLLSTAINIFENCGLLPLTRTFLPFFSYGGTGQLISYSLTGIVLSVYRYQHIIPPARRPESV